MVPTARTTAAAVCRSGGYLWKCADEPAENFSPDVVAGHLQDNFNPGTAVGNLEHNLTHGVGADDPAE